MARGNSGPVLATSVGMIFSADGPLRVAFGQIAVDEQRFFHVPGDAIRGLITESVQSLKAEGLTPERVLMHVKEVAADSGLSPDSSRQPMKAVVTWALLAYFGAPIAGNAEARSAAMQIELALADLRDAFARVRDTPSDPTVLKPAVCAVVDAMKDTGATPERVLKTIKSIARESGFGGTLLGRGITPANDVLESSVSWCVAHYYRGETERLA